ncbi:hypothetical protein KL86PLE_40878 [uncultured Pleomorphomonas sp.]|uniref:Uncharacterized protein n=1 Tax=uncultured Pleomorphomonas sp. TaxID=442121 RepID=A0A212LHN1_9HYPH|nr:hypothetical protein KL86PLE_40878 [uncultured Pleomorphomonas sp.]
MNSRSRDVADAVSALLQSRRPVAVSRLRLTGTDPNVRGDPDEARLTLHGHGYRLRR